MLALLGACLATGCATSKYPEDALRLTESPLDIRSMQTRTYEVSSEAVILAASVGVLQDIEFNIDEVERPLGVLMASKVIDADSGGEMFGLFILEVLGGTGAMQTASDEERVSLTLVVLPSLARDDEYTARITLQRTVFDQLHRVKLMATIAEPEIYQEMFAKLSKSVFLEENQ